MLATKSAASASRLIVVALAALCATTVPVQASRQVIDAISLPAVDPDAAFAQCGSQYYIADQHARIIYKIDRKTGDASVISPKQIRGDPQDVSSSNRNQCWFSFAKPDVLATLQSGDTFKPYYISSESNWLDNITVASNGTVWFSLGRHSQIGYRSATGALRTYNLPMSAKSGTADWIRQPFASARLIAPTPLPTSDTYSFPLPVVEAITTDLAGNSYFLVAALSGTPFIAKVKENAESFSAMSLPNELAFGFFAMSDGTVVVATEPNVLLISPDGATTSIPLPHTQEHCRNRTSIQTASINPSRTVAYFTAPLEGKLYSLRQEHGHFRIRKVFSGTDCPASVVVQDDGKLAVFDPTSRMLTIIPQPQ